MKNHWIVVADASRARVYSSDPLGRTLEPVTALDHPDSRKRSSELASDDRGRARSGVTHLAYEAGTDPAEHAHHLFAVEVAELLAKGHGEGRYAELWLAAPPRFLGMLRDELRDDVRRCVVREVPRDYTQAEPADLPRLFEAHAG